MNRLLLPVILIVCALAPGALRAESPLFSSDTVLSLTLPVDFAEMCRPRETEDCGFTTTELIWRDETGASHNMPIEIKIRGGWRSLTRNCSVPLLWVQFREDAVIGTPFEGQSLLPLTTHCGKGISVDALLRGSQRSNYEQYLLREFIAHRIYNELTEYSLRSRLVRIGYPDPERPSRSRRHYAFFTEHFDALAKRTGTQRLERGGFDAGLLEAQPAARLALFQFMIGNTDWSIARERNTMLVQNGAGRQIPVPYDLDMSGVVDADYAGPAPGLPIESVRDRHYLGYCQPGIDWPALFDHFTSRQAPILALGRQVPGLDSRSRRWLDRYLGSFFRLLAAPDLRQQLILAACKPWPPSPVDHTTPPDAGGAR